jgi:hypothetical protein
VGPTSTGVDSHPGAGAPMIPRPGTGRGKRLRLLGPALTPAGGSRDPSPWRRAPKSDPRCFDPAERTHPQDSKP